MHAPPRFIRSWLGLWALASRATIPVFLVAAMALIAVSLLVRDRSGWAKRRDMALDVAAAVTWLAPISVFAYRPSPWLAFATVVFVVALARAILHRASAWSEIEGNRRSRLLPAFLLSLGIQSAFVVGTAFGWRLAAPVFAAVACGAVWLLTATSVWPLRPASGRDRRPIRAVPAVFMAITASVGGFTPYMSGGGFAGDTDLLKPSWQGVVLWTPRHETTPVTPLVHRKGAGRGTAEQPTSIPFSGAYYFFRGPGDPPAGAHMSFGDATDTSFRSTDGFGLAMEARQTFPEPIDIRGYGGLKLAIRNADRRPGTVRVEVMLRDSRSNKVLWLPPQPVLSMPLENGPAASEMLEYRMSPARLAQFDSIRIVFALASPRLDRSAKIAVDRIVLVPRG